MVGKTRDDGRVPKGPLPRVVKSWVWTTGPRRGSPQKCLVRMGRPRDGLPLGESGDMGLQARRGNSRVECCGQAPAPVSLPTAYYVTRCCVHVLAAGCVFHGELVCTQYRVRVIVSGGKGTPGIVCAEIPLRRQETKPWSQSGGRRLFSCGRWLVDEQKDGGTCPTWPHGCLSALSTMGLARQFAKTWGGAQQPRWT